ncbi:MAG TPA: acetyl/propionyl/methylcrotonyl-CoA carboxylase subunit alpha [Stellaceae bacterium]|nr:acetyl/propionyl/methylcrotonyl-CoA carboxylase subunit alpha [Stellaceae bacterium]
MFAKILIANRGEIACRVVRTARRLGIATVAVYSAADAQALHVAMADEAWPIGPPEPRHSYLDIEKIITAARGSGAQAIHPGYGFLSENAEFAEACAAAGIVFIGPSPAAIRAMGSKAAAKALMQQHGVPVVPGYHGAEQDDARLLAEAEQIGYPVMLKASAGGGGRGMRIVRAASEFARALDGARREAKGGFGDDRMLIERYLERPRHIEVQVFGDHHGNIVHLYERDCSIQRRHQKIVEEAPAPGLDAARRGALGKAAVAAAHAVHYVGAGTVEFIAPTEPGDDAFYFMEMNTRLQVEHPVTEMVTGVDLVEWQLRVAAGEKFTRQQAQIGCQGHAIEVRLYAENPARNFLPSTGTLHALRLPEGAGIRVETGVRQGDTVTPYYDPMIAKIIAGGRDRETARTRLQRALADTAIIGVATNLGFLSRVVADGEFAAAGVDTGFIERRRDTLLAPPAASPPVFAQAAAALHRLAPPAAAPADPWARRDGWRVNTAPAGQTLIFRCGSGEATVAATRAAAGWRLEFGDAARHAVAERVADGRLAVTLDGVRRTLLVIDRPGGVTVFDSGEGWDFADVDPLAPPADALSDAGRLTAPMPGRVVQLLVATGDAVRRGQPLVVIEAMKMEHTIAAPRDGIVAAVHYAQGDLVEEGAGLLALADADDAAGR